VSDAPGWLRSLAPPSREPLKLALLSVLAVLLFGVVGALSRLHFAQQESLADRWSTRGDQALQAQQFSAAVDDFRTALLYSRGNDSYQMNLAEALLGAGKTDEAYVYLIDIRDRQPENGLANLELARIADKKGQTQKAIRFYHNAIYATWPRDHESDREQARFELIDLLLRNQAHAQAQAELIALAANAGDDPRERARIGDLFLQVPDPAQAFTQFQMSLRRNPHSQPTLAGAGRAAFESGRYVVAQRYLEQALALKPSDSESASRLAITDLVLQMDPFQQRLKAAQRNRAVISAFAIAGARIASCRTPATYTAAGDQHNLAQEWNKLNPQITNDALIHNPDLVNTAMDLVFDIERGTEGDCGQPSNADKALVLIANMHEGV
jgi:tetratricopeptide (TPR) repeat protein